MSVWPDGALRARFAAYNGLKFCEARRVQVPEGPEIRRVADALNGALAGRVLTEVWFAFAQLQPWQPRLRGAQVLGVEARGKALLTHFSGNWTLYSHNQLYGRWVIAPAGVLPPTQRTPRVRLEAAPTVAVLYSASDIEIWPSDAIGTHPFLQHIGPDVLDASLDPTAVAARLLLPRFARRKLGTLLLDQSFLAGLGNYLRAEILWTARRHPDDRPAELAAAELQALAEAVVAIPRLSYRTRGTMDEGGGVSFRFQVFKRDGAPCPRCGTPIARMTHTTRPLFLCPQCQAR